jgi:anti-anti-sigma factor
MVNSSISEDQPNRCPVCGNSPKNEGCDSAGDATCPRCGQVLWSTYEDLGDVRVIRPAGEVLSAECLGRLCNSVTLPQGAQLVLDLSNVRYSSAAALSKLVFLYRRVGTAGGTLRIRSLHPGLAELLRVCRLDQVIEVEV